MKAKRFLACLMAVLMVFAFMPNLTMPAYAEGESTLTLNLPTDAHFTVATTETYASNLSVGDQTATISGYGADNYVFVTLTAATGYYFPTNYPASIENTNGMNVEFLTPGKKLKIYTSLGSNSRILTLTDATAKAAHNGKPTVTDVAVTDGNSVNFNYQEEGGVRPAISISVDGGSSWTDKEGGSVLSISGVTTTHGIQIKYAETETQLAGTEILTLGGFTQPDAPTGIDVEACTGEANNDGKIKNVASGMEYINKKKYDDEIRYMKPAWTAITGDTVENVTGGAYYVRYKGHDRVLASESTVVTVPSYRPAYYNVTINVGEHMLINGESTRSITKTVTNGATAYFSIMPETGYMPMGTDWPTQGTDYNGFHASYESGPQNRFSFNGTPTGSVSTIVFNWGGAVAKPKATITTPPVAVTGLVYDGTAHALVDATNAVCSSRMIYSWDQVSWSDDIPEKTDAGTYKIYYCAVGSNTTNPSDKGTLNVTITPKTITPTVTVSGSYTYDGTQQKPAATNIVVKDDSTIINPSEYNVTYGANKNAGTGAGSVTVTDKTGGNYTWTTLATGRFDIAQATPVITIDNKTVKHGGSYPLAPKLMFNNSEVARTSWTFRKTAGIDGVTVDESTGVVSVVADAAVNGTATITISATTTDTNYTAPASKEVTITVTDKEPQNDFALTNPGTKTYGDADFTLSHTDAVGDITYTATPSDVVNVDSTGKVSILKAGTVTIEATAAGDSEYEAATATCTFTVEKATVTVKAKDISIKVGDNISSFVSPTAGTDYTVTGLKNNDTLGGTVRMDYSSKPNTRVAGTYAITISGATVDTDKYNDIVYVNGTLTISEASSGGSTSGGGGGGGGGAAVETPSTTTEQKPGTAEAQVTMDGGKATATVSADTVNKAIEDVNKQTATGEKELLLEVKSEAGTTAVETKIPATAVENLAKSDVNTTLQSACGNLEIPNAAMENIASQASGDLSLSMENKKSDEVVAAAGGAEKLEKATGIDSATLKNADAVEVNMTADGKAITSFGGNKISIFVPLTGNQKAGRTYMAASISADGTIESLAAKCVEIAGKLFGKLEAGHLTTFVVTDKEVNNPFTDVKESDYFYQPVLWAVDQKVTSGTSEDTFSPNAGCTRAQMVTFLWRAAGSPWASANKSFSDVPANAYYKDAIEWAIVSGITTGISETAFDPNGAVTREQLAAFIYRYAQDQGQGFTGAWMFNLDYSDASSISSWADEAMHWCVMKGVVTGTSTDTLTPQGTATRGQIVTMLYRYFGL